ncbi:MAG: NAD(P)H-quinone oxidoreductase [Gaiellaceae bacterium]
MRAVVYTGAGGNEVVQVEERPDPAAGGAEVLVAVRFAGLNPADLMQRAGNYPAPPGSPADVPGLEVAGVVAACGPGVHNWQAGDRVFGIVGGGGLADRVVVHERHLARVPERLSDEEAAAAPEGFITAQDAVVTQAGLRLGELLLVNGANGGVGSSAVQIGLAAGARVFGSVRSDEARARIAALGAVAVAPEEAVEQVRAAGGADVVLELIGAPNLVGDLEALATKGRLVIVGTGAGHEASFSLRAVMGKRLRIHGTVLRARPLEEKAAAVQAFAREIVPLLACGRVRPLVDRIFPVAEIAAAFDHLEAPGKLGKVLVEFD